MAKQSAGLIVYRGQGSDTEVLLIHPGGPLYGRKNIWSIPKGEPADGEDPQAAARREFGEETGLTAPVSPPDPDGSNGDWLDLGTAKQPGGKTNYIWAAQGDPDTAGFKSNLFTMEWPPRSGQMQKFPEVDKIAWFRLSDGLPQTLSTQIVFLERLAEQLNVPIATPAAPAASSPGTSAQSGTATPVAPAKPTPVAPRQQSLL